jgi:hypothetical protein
MSEQQTTLPLHPSLEALNLPPLPWGQPKTYFSTYAADGWEVAYTPRYPDLLTDATADSRRTMAERTAICNMIAAAPELLNVLLQILHDDDVMGYISVENRRAADAIVARALGQKGGSDE